MNWDLGIARLSVRCRNGRRTSIRRDRGSVWPLGPRGPRTERVSVMTHGRKISALASAALLLSALVACSDDTAASNPTDTPAPSSSPSSSTTSEQRTDTAIAEEAASKIVRKYFATVDRLRRNARASLATLKAVTVGGELEAQTLFTRNQREQGYRQVGDTELVDIVTQSVNLDGGTGDEAPTVQLDACWDVSAVDVVDRGGDSIVGPDRPDRGWTRYTLVNRDSGTPSPGAWRVTSSQDLKKAPCSGE